MAGVEAVVRESRTEAFLDEVELAYVRPRTKEVAQLLAALPEHTSQVRAQLAIAIAKQVVR